MAFSLSLSLPGACAFFREQMLDNKLRLRAYIGISSASAGFFFWEIYYWNDFAIRV